MSSPTNESPNLQKRDIFYKVGFVVCAVATAMVGFVHYAYPEQVYIEPQYEQLIEYQDTGQPREELFDIIKRQQSQVASAYVANAYVCKDLTESPVRFENHVTRYEGQNLVTDLDCHLKNGQVKKFTQTFDPMTGSIFTQPRLGPPLSSA